jgi:hypothetical protein
MDSRARLLALTDLIGPSFGTEAFCTFLYSFMKMQRPEVVVELGTGLGTSAFWMALAANENQFGHVWSIDDHSSFERRPEFLAHMGNELPSIGFEKVPVTSPSEFFDGVSRALRIHYNITFLKRQIRLDRRDEFSDYPFESKQIDLLFADFKHGMLDIIDLLAQFLPRMSSASSMFIDSASTYWPSYLLLEQIAQQLTAGNVPAIVQARSAHELRDFLIGRKVTLVHLTKNNGTKQNSTAWLKFEPIDVVPYPQVDMRT